MLFFVLLLLQPADCTDTLKVTGHYVNERYDFEITIPPGMTGLWNSAKCVDDGQDCMCMSDHGRFVELGGDGIVDAYGGDVADDEESLEARARRQFRDTGRDNRRVRRVRRLFLRPAKLDGLPAYHYRVEYLRDGVAQVDEEIVSRSGGVEYSLVFVVRKSSYARWAPVFEAIVKSWRHRE